MDRAYSNFISEYVEAPSAGYGDCKDFQIVCPCCHEAVFKTMRAAGEREVHFFSHYMATKSVVSECEERVASIGKSSRDGVNGVSREQKLAYFLKVVPDEVERMLPDTVVAAARELKDVKAVSVDFSESCRKLFRTHHARTGQTLAALVEENLPNVQKLYPQDAAGSPLARKLRVNSAADVVETLLAENSRPAWSRMFCLSFTAVFADLYSINRRDPRDQKARVGFKLLHEIQGGSRSHANKHMLAVRSLKAEEDELDLVDDMGYLILDGIMSLLLRLDYFAILAARKETTVAAA